LSRPRRHTPPVLPHHAPEFIEAAARRSAATARSYITSLRKLQAFAETRHLTAAGRPLPPEAMPDTMLRDFFLWLDSRQLSNSAMRLYLTVTQRFFEWLEGGTKLPEARTEKMKTLLRKTTGRTNERLRPQRRGSDPAIGKLMFYYRQQLGSLSQRDRLTEARHLICLRNQALLLTLYATAGRAAEVRQITRAQVKGAERVEVKGKRAKKRTLYLSPDAQQAIRAYLNQRGDDRNNYVFVSHRRRTRTAMTTSAMWDVVNEAAKAVFGTNAAGQPNKRFGPHAFRHQRAQDLVDAEVPIEDVQALLDHENILVTRSTYAPKTPRQKIQKQLKERGLSARELAERAEREAE
jgi:site-specific recombinase XerD